MIYFVNIECAVWKLKAMDYAVIDWLTVSWLSFTRSLYAFQVWYLLLVYISPRNFMKALQNETKDITEAGLADSVMFFLSDNWWLIC
jgi:hypothetical protein